MINSHAVFKGEYYFVGESSNSVGEELWKSDGTEEGTVMVKDIWPTYQKSSQPHNFVATTDYLYFVADDGVHGKELWRTDGTEEGTIMLETNDGEFGGMPYSSLGVEFGDYYYFSSCDNCDGGSDDGDLGQNYGEQMELQKELHFLLKLILHFWIWRRSWWIPW